MDHSLSAVMFIALKMSKVFNQSHTVDHVLKDALSNIKH